MTSTSPHLLFVRLGAVLLLSLGAALPHGVGAQLPVAQEDLPLEMERSIEFTTDEGTWLSLDVSPDGRQIVFDMLGDLYVLPIAGGKAKPLTSGPAFDMQPRFSPDGRWIAFVSDRDGADNVWIMRVDGSESRRLSDGYWDFFASPVWLADGEGVVVSRNLDGYWGGYELWLYRVDGGEPVQLLDSAPGRHSSMGPAVSADGRYVYFARRGDTFEYSVSLPLWQVVRLDLQTGDEVPLTAQPGSAFRPVLSSDGRMLAYGARFDAKTGLRLRDLATGADDWLIHPVQRDDQESSLSTMDILPGYAFTPDGRAVLAAYDGKIHRIDVGSGRAEVVPFEVEVVRKIGPDMHRARRVDDGAAVRARVIQDPILSPNGQSVAFSAFGRLHVMSLPDGEPRRLTSANAGEFQPSWSPDGAWIAYVTWDENEGGALWKTRADGSGEPARLTEGDSFYSRPAWSPDGERIAAIRKPRYARLLGHTFQGWPRAREDGGHGTVGDELVWLPSAGGAVRHVTMRDWIGPPQFVAGDPERIYVPTDDGLMSLGLDGRERRVHLRASWWGEAHVDPARSLVTSIQISPSGRHALVRAAGHWLYLVDLPELGRNPLEIELQQPSPTFRRIATTGADYFGWALDGETAVWSIGSTLYRMRVDPGAATDATTIRVTKPRHGPEGLVALRNGRAITMRGDEIIPRADILVRDNRIVAIGPAGSVEIPAEARQIELAGRTVLPGFIDVHAHWRTHDEVLDRQPWGLLAPLAFGVTSGRDPAGSHEDIVYQDMIEAGMMLGPRTFTAGQTILSTLDVQSLDEARDVLTRYSHHYGVETVKSYAPGNRRQRHWVAMASREQGVSPTTEGWMDLRLGMTIVLDGHSGHEHNFPQVPLFKDVVEVVAQSKILYTPTLLVVYGGPEGDSWFLRDLELMDDPRIGRYIPPELLLGVKNRRPWVHPDEHVFPQTAASTAKIARAGGRVGVGAHGQLDGPDFHWEMWAMHAEGEGMTPMEVLRAATIHAAEAIGYGADLGSLEPGKLADLVVLSGDPLADFSNSDDVVFVMKNGELFDAPTLTRIWPEPKSLAPLWWWSSSEAPKR